MIVAALPRFGFGSLDSGGWGAVNDSDQPGCRIGSKGEATREDSSASFAM